MAYAPKFDVPAPPKARGRLPTEESIAARNLPVGAYIDFPADKAAKVRANVGSYIQRRLGQWVCRIQPDGSLRVWRTE